MTNAFEWVKRIYLYIAEGIGLVLLIIGSVQLINLGLKALIFTQADIYRDYPISRSIDGEKEITAVDEEKLAEYQQQELVSRRQRQAANAIAFILVGAPVFLYHWRIARRKDK